MGNALVHHHYIFQASVGRNDLGREAEEKFRIFFHELIEEIEMEELIPPSFAYSKNDAWTGLIGIITSHISFHYWTIEQYVQLDIYSCKKFDIDKTRAFLQKFWDAFDIKDCFIVREPDSDFQITLPCSGK